jgi:hypothetical protein
MCKTIDGKNVSTLWERGMINEIIKYNANDCRITFWLWWHMLINLGLKVFYEGKYETEQLYFDLTPNVIEYLIGNNYKFHNIDLYTESFSPWYRKIRDGINKKYNYKIRTIS